MHPFVSAVLLGTGREDPLVLNAVNPGGRERHPVVGTNDARQPVLAEEALEDRADALALGREQALTAEQVARVLIGDRQRVAIDAIAGSEVVLEVRGPEVVRPFRRRGHHPGVAQEQGRADLGPWHADLARPPGDVVEIESTDLARAQAVGGDEHEHRVVASPLRRRAVDRAQERADRLPRQCTRKTLAAVDAGRLVSGPSVPRYACSREPP